MQPKYDYDAIIIGSGPGYKTAVMGLRKRSVGVAVIKCYDNVGGGGIYWGNISSKVLIQALSRIIEVN